MNPKPQGEAASRDLLDAMPPTDDELPIGDPVEERSDEGDERDTAGEHGPMAVETAASFPPIR